MSDEREYEVGYGKPPKANQFRKGQSGNPKGRPKGSRNLATIFNEVAYSRIPVTIGGGPPRTVPLVEAIITQMGVAGAKGNRHSGRDFLHFAALSEAREEAEADAEVPHERDKTTLQNALRRLRKAQAELEDSAGTLRPAKDPEESEQ